MKNQTLKKKKRKEKKQIAPTKLGRKTGHFSFGEKFSFSFSFSAARPKTKMPKYFFVDPSGRKIYFEWPTKKTYFLIDIAIFQN
jgi:hypothetical protein